MGVGCSTRAGGDHALLHRLAGKMGAKTIRTNTPGKSTTTSVEQALPHADSAMESSALKASTFEYDPIFFHDSMRPQDMKTYRQPAPADKIRQSKILDPGSTRNRLPVGNGPIQLSPDRNG